MSNVVLSCAMDTLAEIEAAIERLPAVQFEKLAQWLDERRPVLIAKANVEAWMARAQGAARRGVTTAQVMAEMRGDE